MSGLINKIFTVQDDSHEDEDREDGEHVEGDLEEPDRISEPKPALLETRNTEKKIQTCKIHKKIKIFKMRRDI